MVLLLLLLSIPLLSLLVLVVDRHAQRHAAPDEQEMWRLVRRGLGAGLAGAGLAALGLLIAQRPELELLRIEDLLISIVVGLYSSLAVVGGILGEWCARKPEPTTVVERARHDRNQAIFQLACWCLMLLPLAGFVPPLVIVAPACLTTMVLILSAMRAGQRSNLLHRMAIAMESSLPLADEIDAAAYGLPSAKAVPLLSLADRLRSGRTLSDALSVGTPLVPRSTILAIRAAEGTDQLPVVLRQAADASIQTLTEVGGPRDLLPLQSYLISVLFILLGVISFLMYWIIPKFKNIFNDFGVELPGSTMLLIHLSDGMGAMWYLSLPMILIPMALLFLPFLVATIGWENLNAPLLMRWFPRRDAPELLRTLSVGVAAEQPLPLVLSELAAHHHRQDLQRRLHRIVDSVEQGESPWAALRRERIVRADEQAALEASAAAGHLPWALRSLGDVIESQQKLRTGWWLEWTRPVLLIAFASVVGFCCIALFLPLVRLLNDLTSEVT
ncbi:MAG: type II secretion system F family protein [Planctomyces sp.]|nr:type II secretion system F family protein [Planctomyces sp.]